MTTPLSSQGLLQGITRTSDWIVALLDSVPRDPIRPHLAVRTSRTSLSNSTRQPQGKVNSLWNYDQFHSQKPHCYLKESVANTAWRSCPIAQNPDRWAIIHFHLTKGCNFSTRHYQFWRPGLLWWLLKEIGWARHVKSSRHQEKLKVLHQTIQRCLP